MAFVAGARRTASSLARLPMAAILALLLLFPCQTLAALFPPGSAVLSLDARSFPSKILQVEKPAIVAFTAPWCGHCQRLTPEFTKAAKNLEGIVHFGNVDCDDDKNKQMCAQYEVKGFPTILVFPATKRRIPRPYQGERAAKALVEYAVSTLPHSVKKLNGEEMAGWVRGLGPPTTDGNVTKGVNGRGKVLLLSNKPTSSPLYKSLALDFRGSFDFAFARGDQSTVRSLAKNTLGINLNRDEDLPILVVFPPPSMPTAEGEDKFEKGKFETYEGKLKMTPLTEWLQRVKEKYDIDSSKNTQSGAAGGSKKTKPESSKKKGPSHADTFDDPLPEGGFYEWRPANDDTSRYSKQAEEIKAQYNALKKKEKGQKADAEKMAFGEKHRVPKNQKQVPFQSTNTPTSLDDLDSAPPPEPQSPVGEGDDSPPKSGEEKSALLETETPSEPSPAISHSASKADAAETAEASPSSRGYLYTDGQRADLDALNTLLEEAGAYDLAEKATRQAEYATDGLKNSARQVYENVRKAAQAMGGQKEEAEVESMGEGAPFIKKRKALLSAFTKWLQDEHPDWEEDYSSDILTASKDVEQLLRNDPEKALRMAEESEAAMLAEFKIDLEHMGGESVLGEGKRKKLNELITLLEGRVGARKAAKRRDEWIKERRDKEGVPRTGHEGEERVVEAIRGLTGEDAQVGGIKEKKHARDEL